MDSSSCSHNSAPFSNTLHLIPNRGGKVCRRAYYASLFTESSYTFGRRTCTFFLRLFLFKSNWFSSMGIFSVIYNMPLFYQVVLNLSSAKAGLRLIPSSIGASLGSLGYGIAMAKTVILTEIHVDS
jgi:hypothetical protein